MSSDTNRTLDLNRLRQIVLDSQRSREPLQRPPGRMVVVDREGNLFLDSQESHADGPLSQVHTGTFAAVRRMDADRETAVKHPPSNARRIDESGMRGFLYSIRTELGDSFTMFLFHDGTGYQVTVVQPDLGEHDPHDIHFFTNGMICWGEPAGMGLPAVAMAFAKSVLWANGVSVFLRADHFPFSVNNRQA